jgi:hypothetical protein
LTGYLIAVDPDFHFQFAMIRVLLFQNVFDWKIWQWLCNASVQWFTVD